MKRGLARLWSLAWEALPHPWPLGIDPLSTDDPPPELQEGAVGPSVCWCTPRLASHLLSLPVLLTLPASCFIQSRLLTFTFCVCVLVAQSRLTLCDPRDYNLQVSSVCGILQAGILEWVAIPFSRGSFQPRDLTQVSCLASRLLTVSATREALTFTLGPCYLDLFLLVTSLPSYIHRISCSHIHR